MAVGIDWIRDGPGHRDHHAVRELSRAHLAELPVAIDGEEVVTSGHAHAPTGSQADLEDPVLGSLVEPGDLVVADLEACRDRSRRSRTDAAP